MKKMYIATVEWEDYGNEHYNNLCVIEKLDDETIENIISYIHDWGINEFGCVLDDETSNELEKEIKGKTPPFYVEFGERSTLKIFDIDVIV